MKKYKVIKNAQFNGDEFSLIAVYFGEAKSAYFTQWVDAETQTAIPWVTELGLRDRDEDFTRVTINGNCYVNVPDVFGMEGTWFNLITGDEVKNQRCINKLTNTVNERIIAKYLVDTNAE